MGKRDNRSSVAFSDGGDDNNPLKGERMAVKIYKLKIWSGKANEKQ